MNIITKNKKTNFEYHIIDKFTAGIKLHGGEVKSIRANKVSINECYCYVLHNEVFIRGMHISEYKQNGNYDKFDPVRDRKLLLTKKEIQKLNDDVDKKGLTIVPLSIIINDGGLIKVEIALVKGKKLYDKREALKERDLNRELNLNF